jgi:superfamily II DNA or RNA helicase
MTLRTISARIDGEIVLSNGLPARTRERLFQKFSLPNPKYQTALRFGRSPGGEPERIEAAVMMPDGTLHCPRGAMDLIREELFKDEFLVDPVDHTKPGTTIEREVSVMAGLIPHPRDYQFEGVRQIARRLQGLVVLPCGTGKSKLGCYAIEHLKVSTLILVPTLDLADQWARELAVFGFRRAVITGGTIYGSRDVHGSNLAVGVIDSVDRLLQALPTWGGRFGMVILDEAHHAPANTFQRVLRLLPARYRIGLTATPDREDGLTRLVQWSFGPILLQRTAKEMIAQGYLMLARIEMVETGWRWIWEGPEDQRLQAMEEALAEDVGRNLMIAQRVATEAKAGETCLVLCKTRNHTKELARMICEQGVEAEHVTGQTPKKQRKGALDRLREGSLPVAVATSLADEGLDVPRLSFVGLASPQRAQGRTLQRLGRVLRLWPGKKPKLVDWVDGNIATLQRRADSRRRVYRDVGLVP